jgi:hypothetical protein
MICYFMPHLIRTKSTLPSPAIHQHTAITHLTSALANHFAPKASLGNAPLLTPNLRERTQNTCTPCAKFGYTIARYSSTCNTILWLYTFSPLVLSCFLASHIQILYTYLPVTPHIILSPTIRKNHVFAQRRVRT